MTAASFWSLMAPAIEMAEKSGSYGEDGQWAFIPVAAGFILGAAFVYGADIFMPYLVGNCSGCKSFFLNPIPDNKILGLSKLKVFADDKLNITQNIKVVFHRIANILGKEENAGYQHFLLFPHCFQKAFSSIVSKVVIV